MAQTPEGKVKAQIRNILLKHDVFYFMPVNNGMGRMGVADFICCLPNGMFLAIEAKAGDGKPTELQKQFISKVQMHKGYACVINETLLTHLDEFLKEILDGRKTTNS